MRQYATLVPFGRDRAIIREFLSALTDPETYSPHRNGYVFFGVLWGLPVPIVTIGVDLFAQHRVPTPQNILAVFLIHPFQLIFLLHPLLFAVLFGALGTIRERKEQHIHALVENLHAKLVELETLNAQLLETDKLKDEFLGTISHELKTPLVTIRGYAEMLLHGRAGAISPRQTRPVKQVLKNVDRQIQLIDDLLIYIRIRRRPDDRERRELDMRETIRRTRETFAPSLEKKGLKLDIVLPDVPLMVFATRSDVEIVLNNLLSNAIKFTEAGGEIRIEAREGEKGRVLTSCSDTGCGIPKDAIPHVFERFRQVDGSTRRKHGGTGLGLAIVKKILDNYNCSIAVDSELGKGTRFCFDLPAAAARQPAGAAEAVEGRKGNGGGE